MEDKYHEAFKEALEGAFESWIVISPEFCEKAHRLFELVTSGEGIVEEETPSKQICPHYKQGEQNK